MKYVFSLLVLACIATPLAARPLPVPDPPSFSGKSNILLDFESGQVLASKEQDMRIEPASITKIMTAYIAFAEIKKGNLALGDMLTVSENAWRMGGSKMFIEVGKQVSIDDILHGLIVVSGNDATVALAEHIAGSEDSFAGYMNQYAEEMNLSGTHFVNATGWPDEDHYMTARDIATLTRHLIEDFPELYAKYYSVKEYTYNDIQQYNRNSLLWTDKSVDGVKTGHTDSAGYCLVTSAKRDGMRLISVVTGTNSNNARKTASQALLNYGFRFFETYKMFDADQAISQVRVWKGASDMLPITARGPVYVIAPRGQRKGLTTTAELPSRIIAPVAEDQKLGILKISYEDQVIAERPLYAEHAVESGGIFQQLKDEVLMLFQ